jgi:hypothetical protein
MDATAKIDVPISVLVRIINIIARFAFMFLLFRVAEVVYHCFISLKAPIYLEIHSGKEAIYLPLYNFSKPHFYFVLCLTALHYAVLAYASAQATLLFTKQNFASPFYPKVAVLVARISYALLLVGILSVIYNLHNNLLRQYKLQSAGWNDIDWFIAAVLVYIVFNIINKGIALQTEKTA